MTSNRTAPRWRFHRAARWAELAPVWDRVNGAAGALPFLESAFLTPLLAHFGAGDETIAIGELDGRPVAAALLGRSRHGQAVLFQPSQLPLGPWLVETGQDMPAMAHSLLAQLPGLRLGLGLTQLDPRLLARPQAAPTLATLDYIETGWVDVDGPFATYWDARGKNLRANIRKQRNKLEGEGIAIRFDTLTAPDDVPAAIADYGRLEAAGWKGEMGTSVQPDNAQGRFYTEMLRNFCAVGRGRIWRMRFGDKVVAMDLCIEGGGTLVDLKTAFDPEYRSVSPAFLMRHDAFKEEFDAGRIRRIEFYGRMMEWHTRWTEQSRTLYHANVYRWALVPTLRRLLRRGAAAPAAEPEPAEAAPAAPQS